MRRAGRAAGAQLHQHLARQHAHVAFAAMAAGRLGVLEHLESPRPVAALERGHEPLGVDGPRVDVRIVGVVLPADAGGVVGERHRGVVP